MRLAVIPAAVLERLTRHRDTERDVHAAFDAIAAAEDPDYGGRCPWCGHLTQPTPHVDTRQQHLDL